jgi:hypothetical protein
MKHSLVIPILLILGSCATLDRMEKEDKIKKEHAKQIVYNCDPQKPNLNCADVVSKFQSEIPQTKSLLCVKLKDEECQLKLNEVLISRFRIKYSYAKLKDVDGFCGAYPLDCASHDKMEAIFATLHNKEVEAAIKNDVQEVRKIAAQDNRWGEALSGLGKSLKGDPVKQSNCTSRPDGFGGYRTDCTSY